MLENTELYRDKGNYNHPQPHGLIAVKQYVFATQNGKRTLLLRFANESPLSLDGFEFVVTELDRRGEVLDRHKISHTGISVEAGGTYCPPSGIIVRGECTDFLIKVISVHSGMYRYTQRRGQIVAHYDKQRRSTSSKKPKHGYTEVKSMRSTDGRVFTLITVIAILIICITSAMARYHSKDIAALPDVGSEGTHISV